MAIRMTHFGQLLPFSRALPAAAPYVQQPVLPPGLVGTPTKDLTIGQTATVIAPYGLMFRVGPSVSAPQRNL